jgi:hypothetical protein
LSSNSTCPAAFTWMRSSDISQPGRWRHDGNAVLALARHDGRTELGYCGWLREAVPAAERPKRRTGPRWADVCSYSDPS